MEDPTTSRKSIQSWQDLRVWKASHDLVLKVYQLTKDFPAEERFRLTDQLCRAAASVPTNIVEGKSRHSVREYRQFLTVARGSVEELKYLVLLGMDLGYVQGEHYAQMTADCEQIGKMLNGLIRSLRAGSAGSSGHPAPDT